MDKLKILLQLKITILILLIALWIIFEMVPKNDCQGCGFIIDDRNISTEKFIETYFEECVYPNKQPLGLPSDFFNLSRGDVEVENGFLAKEK